jgi:hypothetical protein
MLPSSFSFPTILRLILILPLASEIKFFPIKLLKLKYSPQPGRQAGNVEHGFLLKCRERQKLKN